MATPATPGGDALMTDNVSPIVAANSAAALDHLMALFGRAMDGKIEITALKAVGPDERASPRTRFFSLDQIDLAAEWALEVNREPQWNVYVGAALRRESVFPGSAADDTDFLRTYAVWADADNAEQVASAKAAYDAAGMQPAMIVVTGRTPERRAQFWWPLEAPIGDIDTLRATVRGIADTLGTDHGVLTGKQLMRLAGSLAWPKPNKPGRVLEVVELVKLPRAAREFSLEALHKAFPPVVRASASPDEKAPEPVGSIQGALAVKDLRDALSSLPSDDRELWVRMGHALKGLGDVGHGLWLEWSSKSGKYEPDDAMRVWLSLRGERTDYRAVFAEAQRQGWENPATQRPRERDDVSAEDDPEDDDDGPFPASSLTGAPPERQWVVKDWIVEGAVNSLYGDGGLGKTLLAQQLACAVSMGAPWLGLPTKQGPVLAVLCEDDKDELHRRHNDIKAAAGYTVGNPFTDVLLWPRVGQENVLIRWNKDSQPVLGGFYQRIVTEVERHGPSLLILDTLADFYAGNEIDRPSVNYFVKTVLGGLIKRQQETTGLPLTVLLLGHPSQSGKATGAGYSGSTAWNNAVRSRMYLTRPEEGDGDERILTRGKANYAKSGDETALRLFFANGVLHAADDADDGDSMLWAAKEEAVRLTDRAWVTGRPYSAQKTHARYIFKALAADMTKGGFSPQLTRQALRELIVDDGVLTVSKSHDKRGYRSAKHGD